jgi:hypothetical protein
LNFCFGDIAQHYAIWRHLVKLACGDGAGRREARSNRPRPFCPL